MTNFLVSHLLAKQMHFFPSGVQQIILTFLCFRQGEADEEVEQDLWEAVQKNNVETIHRFRDKADVLSRDLPFLQAVISEAIGLANKEMVTAVVDLFACNNQQAYQVRIRKDMCAICKC